MPRRSSRLILALFAAPLLMASKCKKDKQPDDLDTTDVTPVDPAVELRVTGVEPDTINAGELRRAMVYGSGFEEGVQVRVDESPVSSVTVQDSGVLRVTLPPLDAGTHDLRVRNPDGTTATLRNAILAQAAPTADVTAGLGCRSITVRFELDQSRLTKDSRELLREKLACFTERQGEIRIEGHCDERGTTDYNLALGQRRADAVKDWMMNQGVPPRRLRVVSYGEEKPVNQGHNEAAWAQNRRAEISAARR